MFRTRKLSCAVLLAIPLLPPQALHGKDLPDRASLADLQVIGQIIVTMSAASAGGEDVLRQVVERRLAMAGIATDPAANSQLVVNVAATRSTSAKGLKHFSYLITLTLKEPVHTDREPRTSFLGTTWSSNATANRFGTDVASDTIVDVLDNKMSTFLATVAADTGAATQARARLPLR